MEGLMPALRKKKKSVTEYKRMVGPRPLPAHFGEIDVTAPFDPNIYFTMLRCVGSNPMLRRDAEGKVWYSFDELFSPTALQKRRREQAFAWASAKDSGGKKLNAFCKKLMQNQPEGFIFYLG
jgi:hypothetical protein